MKNPFRKRYTGHSEVEPDEIFIDAENLPQFDTQQFEGRLERPITKLTVGVLGTFFILVGGLFLWKLSVLQIAKGEAYYDRSENNTLDKKPLFADRGVIYDRNGVELAWNSVNPDDPAVLKRSYIRTPGFGHIVGYVSYPAKDKSGFYWQEDFIGKDGIEKQYNDLLKGKNGVKIIETDARGETQSENIINRSDPGKNISLGVDSRLQAKLYESIKNLADQASFKGGSAIVMDVNSGELLSLTSYPEYDPEVLSWGEDRETIAGYMSDKRSPFLDRGVTGRSVPGSIVKPIVSIAALNEGVINPLKQILSTGSISIPNPYFPDKKTVFNDWKAHGWVDMRHAIAVSSDVYFYEIGGGFQDQKGIGIANIEKYSRMFGIGERTGIDLSGEVDGVIPSPDWKAKTFNGDQWRIGDTYNTAIGQYGFQVTPLQMVRAIGAIANGGTLVTPHLLKDSPDYSAKTKLSIPKDYFDIVKEGMRLAVTEGTAGALLTDSVSVAAKTGTAQVGVANRSVNSWVVGFFPYEHPKYAFAILMENGPSTNTTGASVIMRDMLEYAALYAPEYLE